MKTLVLVFFAMILSTASMAKVVLKCQSAESEMPFFEVEVDALIDEVSCDYNEFSVKVKRTTDGFPGPMVAIKNFKVTKFIFGEDYSNFTFEDGSLVVVETDDHDIMSGLLNVSLYGVAAEVVLSCKKFSSSGFSQDTTRNDGEIPEMKFALISKGSFTMGSPESEPNRDNDEKQRSVTITYDYEMMTTEVTQAMYFEVTGRNPSYFKNQIHCPLSFETKPTKDGIESLCPDNPVETVSFNDVLGFIATLNAKTGMNYRLPTEAEWEYAARADSQTAYTFGDSLAFLSENGIYRKNSKSKTHPVGPMRGYANNPNSNGLYDMHGNVWEWTQDRYTKSPSGGVNPTGPTTGLNRVYRGGSWLNFGGYLRSASRDYLSPSPRLSSVGLRLVR